MQSMTEAEWNASRDLDRMLWSLRHRVNERKPRLFGAACARRVWHLLLEQSRAAVEAAEQFANALVEKDVLVKAHSRAGAEASRLTLNSAAWYAARAAVSASYPGTGVVYQSHHTAEAAARAVSLSGDVDEYPAYDAECVAQCGLLRDIVGCPFRPLTLDRRWLTPTVAGIAHSASEERRFSALPVLADALDDAGCQDATLLNHLRGPGPHALGCWALDLILGQS
jgi:hypothetical protein